MVMYWDTSAVIPLTINEPATAAVRAMLGEDAAMAVWWGTRVECVSALARRQRDGGIAASAARDARRIVKALAGEWTEVVPTELVRNRAERLLAVHTIRAADALQLAAALVWARDDPAGNTFVCLDERLRDAAAREGFQLLPAQP
jgi:hypothetical protein